MSQQIETILATDNSRAIKLKTEQKKTRRKKRWFILLLLPAVVLLIALGVQTGSVDLSVGDVLTTILHRIFPDVFGYIGDSANKIIWELRLPRVLMALLAGIGLAGTGCVMQATLKNPLADPLFLGISSGAGFGATLVIIFGIGVFTGPGATIISAFICAMVVSLVIIGMSSFKGAKPVTMLLVGLAMTYLFDKDGVMVYALS